MTPILSQQDKTGFKVKVEKYMNDNGREIPFEIKDWDDKTWAMLFIAKKGNETEDSFADFIEGMFESFKLSDEDYVGYGFQEEYDGYIWVVSHPDIPQSVRDMIDEDIEAEEEEEKTKEIEEYTKNGRIPTPKKQKSSSDTVYLVLAREFFDDIKNGDKKVEYRELNQYYANKLLGKDKPLKYVLLQNGYGGKGHVSPEQMKFEIKEIVYSDDSLEESPCYNDNGTLVTDKELPKGFYPTMYGIKLGTKIDFQ